MDPGLARPALLFQNLIGNAIKFHRAGVPPRVQIEHRELAQKDLRGQAMHELTVSDNGIGIENRHLEQIFHPFVRLHPREEFDGAGIGLAICLRIVRSLHGTISVNSVVGEGTKFIIRVPSLEPTNMETSPP